MALTKEQKDIIRNHFSEIPRDMEVFKNLIDVKIDDKEKKDALLAMIEKFEAECAEVKDIIETLN